MRVLIGFEESAVVRDRFLALGHDAWSCDLLPSRGSARRHLQSDIRKPALNKRWDLGIFFPPCTYLASSGVQWNKTRPERVQRGAEALKMIQWLMGYQSPK